MRGWDQRGSLSLQCEIEVAVGDTRVCRVVRVGVRVELNAPLLGVVDEGRAHFGLRRCK